MRKLIKIYNLIEEYFGDLLLFASVSLVFISILMRYVFRAPIPWADELYTIIFAWAMTLGYSVATRDNEHIKMDAIDMVVKNKTIQNALELISLFFSIVFSFVLCYYGFLAAMQQLNIGRVTPTLMIPRWIIYMVIPYTGLIMTIRYVVRFVMTIKGMISSKDKKDEV